MPRPISWLPRLHHIADAVATSVRSHYDRRDLEKLFELQPRAAQKLLEMLPVVTVGTSRLVEREALAAFLERVREAEDTTGLLKQMRDEKPPSSRRKIRSLVRRDLERVGLTSLPDSIDLTRGRLILHFQSVEHLAESMLMLARILEDEGEEFARAYEPLQLRPTPPDADEVAAMFAALDDLPPN